MPCARQKSTLVIPLRLYSPTSRSPSSRLRRLLTAKELDSIMHRVQHRLNADGRVDLLGRIHISGKNRNGDFAVKRKTVGKRMRAKLLELKQQLRNRRHDPTELTGKWLQSIVRGYFNYHAIPGNTDCLHAFRYRLVRFWRTMLSHRSQRHHLNWAKMQCMADKWLPKPRVLHPYPSVRFDAIHPR